ncbi:DUF2019 domain-containing protein [Paenibacillus woosongensis]|uniref:DUF2019 domain-containing protein n=1 Tax=Paenibacillus woosongensis TaxID=307580 RepID=UPI0039B6ED56
MRIDLRLQGFQLRLLLFDLRQIHLFDKMIDVLSHLIQRGGDLRKFILALVAHPFMQVAFAKSI